MIIISKEMPTSVTNEWDYMPRGIIPRIEKQKKHLDFLKDNPHVTWIMLDIHHAENLVKRKQTALSFFGPKIKVITTTTISDETLEKYHLEKEVAIIKTFKPDCHIPCDWPVYYDDYEKKRLWIIKCYLEDLSQFFSQINGLGTKIIPLVKGVTLKERTMCYRLFDYLNLDYLAFYAGQYFGPGRGNRSTELANKITKIVSETGGKRMMLIGALSINCIKKFPPQVVASSGLHQWINNSHLREVPIEQAQKKYNEWVKDVIKKSNYSQTTLNMFMAKKMECDSQWAPIMVRRAPDMAQVIY